ncbi:MAG: App1 family protein [Lysobacterales bacterium]
MRFRLPCPAWFQILGLALLMVGCQSTGARSLSRSDQVLFLPSTARQLGADQIEMRVESWVFEFERRPGLSALLAHHLDLDPEQMAIGDRNRFYARTQLFRVDSESRKQIALSLPYRCAGPGQRCDQPELPRSNGAGRSSSRLLLSAPAGLEDGDWIEFSVVMPAGDARQFEGRALWLAPEGLSVISDIDDTIKVSEVGDRRQMLLNTFVHEFAAVPGMAAQYQQLAQESHARFHYVSSSPIQLYSPLAQFLDDQGFPRGSVHLRESTSFTSLIPRKGDSSAHKRGAIGQLLSDFPDRRFLLIGDSGESDPEIYGEIAREHRDQVLGIRIRQVGDAGSESERYRRSFRDLPTTLWQVFDRAGSMRLLPQTAVPEPSLLPGS